MKNKRRIVCYAINGAGLGHLTRLVSVGRWLRRFVTLLEDQPPEILFLTSSDASDVLAQAGFACFKIPSKTVAGRAELDKLEYRRLAKHFVWQTLGVFSPDLLVVDTFPSGSFDELFQVLDGPFKKSFIFRDVKPEYAARPIFRSALGLYDALVVPHRRQTFCSGRLLPETAACFSGEVVQFDRDELLPKDVARRELGVSPDHNLVYLSAGGGGDPDVESTHRSLVSALRDEPNMHLLVGAGPLYRGNRIAGPHLIWFDSPNIWRYFAACDAAISAAGYNTFHELIYARVPTAFYAQDKIADDQSRRIDEAESEGACFRIEDVSDLEEIQIQARQLLDPSTSATMKDNCTSFLPANGARRCALQLLQPLYDVDSLGWAEQVLTTRLVHSLERIGNGSASVLSAWLSPLMPRGRSNPISNHPELHAMIGQLSKGAAEEMSQLLAARHDAKEQSAFEDSLIELITAVDQMSGSHQNVEGLAEQVLKTLLAAMKKQPWNTANGGWTPWIRTIVARIGRLTRLDDLSLSVPDVLQLYRVFPRVADADCTQAFELFEHFLRQSTSRGARTHEIMHALQVMKMAHQRVTCDILESQLEGART